jgi:hypothetical protein
LARDNWQCRSSLARGGERCSRAAERKGREEDDGDLFEIFQKVQGVHCEVRFFFQTIAQMKICPKAKVWSLKRSTTLI